MPPREVVAVDPATRETSVPGLYAIGSAGQGGRTSDVFIENGLPHARAAVAHVAARFRRRGRGPRTPLRAFLTQAPGCEGHADRTRTHPHRRRGA